MSKHRVGVIAVAVVVAAVAVAATAVAQPTQRFGDVPPDHYAFDAVAWMADNNITTGCGDGTDFCPDRPLTRVHIAAFLYRYHQNVILGGNGDGAVAAGPVTVKDSYWSADRDHYYVVITGVAGLSYCEAHLTLDGRRTGEWGNTLWTGRRSTVTVQVAFVEHPFDGVEIECS